MTDALLVAIDQGTTSTCSIFCDAGRDALHRTLRAAP